MSRLSFQPPFDPKAEQDAGYPTPDQTWPMAGVREVAPKHRSAAASQGSGRLAAPPAPMCRMVPAGPSCVQLRTLAGRLLSSFGRPTFGRLALDSDPPSLEGPRWSRPPSRTQYLTIVLDTSGVEAASGVGRGSQVMRDEELRLMWVQDEDESDEEALMSNAESSCINAALSLLDEAARTREGS